MDSFELSSARATARIDLLAGRLGSLIVDDMELLLTEGAKREHWPFGGSVTQRFEVTNESFTVHMSVTAGEHAMPAQMGWHPWYRRELTRGGPLEVEFAAGQVYETNDEQIPTGELIPVPVGPWDETFVDVTQTPILRWGDALTVALSSNFDHWVVFTQPDHAVAIEPQSGAPNDLNRAPHILAPGESLLGWMTLTWG